MTITRIAFLTFPSCKYDDCHFSLFIFYTDTSVYDTNDLVVKGTNLRVATTSKLVELVMEPVEMSNNETLRRHLLLANQQRRLPQICGGEEWSYGGGGSDADDWFVNNEGTTCKLQGKRSESRDFGNPFFDT